MIFNYVDKKPGILLSISHISVLVVVVIHLMKYYATNGKEERSC
jgi:hypothetical protein